MGPRTDVPSLAALILVIAAAAIGAAIVTADDGSSHSVATDGNLTVLRAPGSVAETLVDVDAVRAARANDTLRPDEYAVEGDTIVFEIQSERVNESFAEADGANATDRFLQMLAESDTNLTMESQNRGPELPRIELSFAESGAHVVRDRTNATFYVVIDTGNALFRSEWNDSLVEEDLDHIEFGVTVDATVTDGTEQILKETVEFAPRDAGVRTSNDRLRFEGGDPARIDAGLDRFDLGGRTNHLPESPVTVRVIGPNGTELAAERTWTTENRSVDGPTRSDFDVTVRGVPTDTLDHFTFVVSSTNETLEEKPVVVGPPPRWSDLSATYVRNESGDRKVRISATMRLPDDGVIGTYEEREFVGTAAPPGESRQTLVVDDSAVGRDGRVRVSVAWDVNGNGEFDFPDETFATTADSPDLRGASEDTLIAAVPVEENSTTPPTLTETAASTPQTSSPETGSDSGETASPIPEGDTDSPLTRATTETIETATGDNPTTTEVTGSTGPGFDVTLALLAVAVTLVAWIRRQ